MPEGQGNKLSHIQGYYQTKSNLKRFFKPSSKYASEVNEDWYLMPNRCWISWDFRQQDLTSLQEENITWCLSFSKLWTHLLSLGMFFCKVMISRVFMILANRGPEHLVLKVNLAFFRSFICFIRLRYLRPHLALLMNNSFASNLLTVVVLVIHRCLPRFIKIVRFGG